MLEFIDIGLEKAIAYRLDGKITKQEMSSVFALFKEKIDKGEKLIVFQEVEGFGGVEVEAMAEKLKFFIDFGLSHFSRIAVVTPKKWLHKLVDLEGRLFKNIDIKGFPIEQKDKAVEFLKNA